MSAQLDVILADMKKFVDAMDLTRDNLAADLMEIAVEEMKANIAAGLDCNDQPFEQLSQLYQISKGRHFPGRPISVLHGLMTSDAELRGVQTFNATVSIMSFGTTQEAVDEAGWFQDPSSPNQPAREFYGLTLRAVVRMDQRVDEAFN